MNQISLNLPAFFNTSVTLFNLLIWVFFGVITGAIANFFDPNPSANSLVGNITLGILGALIGGFLANIVLGPQGVTEFNLTSLIIVLVGSLLFLLIRRLFIHNNRHIKTTIEHK